MIDKSYYIYRENLENLVALSEPYILSKHIKYFS